MTNYQLSGQGFCWQDQGNIVKGEESNDWKTTMQTGVTWNSSTRTVSIDLSEFIKDTRFANSADVNFILGLWWYNGAEAKNIDVLDIKSANIVTN